MQSKTKWLASVLIAPTTRPRQVPWRALGHRPVEVLVDSLYVLLRPSAGGDYDASAALAAKRAEVAAHFAALVRRAGGQGGVRALAAAQCAPLPDFNPMGWLLA